MARSKSSSQWLKEHFDDTYVKRAQKEGWRSRAVFKLEALLKRDHLLKKSMVVVDLGAAPGGWSQWISQWLDKQSRIIALDLLPVEPIPGVECIVGDFREQTVLDSLEATLEGQKIDLVLSDMAPNMSGVTVTDQARAMYLAELALDFSKSWLKPGGSFLIKLFTGKGFDDYVRDLRTHFKHVKIRKPEASRARSREVYAVASGYR